MKSQVFKALYRWLLIRFNFEICGINIEKSSFINFEIAVMITIYF